MHRSCGFLAHFPYLSVLPSTDKLRTSLYFTPSELDAFKGTNIYQATIDREREWRQEWGFCRSIMTDSMSEWAKEFTWSVYACWA
jgi:hypothetical protein